MTVVIDFPEKVAAVPMTETALSAADAAGFLASLQLRNLGPEAAAKILEPALKQEPASATANVAMARIDLARHDPAGAAKRVLASAPEDDWFAAYSAGVTLTEAVEEDRSRGPGGTALTRASQRLKACAARMRICQTPLPASQRARFFPRPLRRSEQRTSTSRGHARSLPASSTTRSRRPSCLPTPATSSRPAPSSAR